MQPNLAPLLNLEILALAKRESKTDEKQMEALMDELAELCGVKRRQLYHWRSGHYPLPGEHVPALCKRFGSNALLDALKTATETTVEIPDNFDLAITVSRALREDLEGFERLLLAFETDGIQPGELAELNELEARAHRNLHVLFGIAAADCARRLAAEAPELAPRKGSVRIEKRREETAAEGSLVKARR